MITTLKGAPAISIDQDGIMAITTVWMLIDDSDTNVYTRWLAFENDVHTWVGEVGDAYKRPIQDENGREASTYESDDTFICQSINYNCVDGRTHYEVTFTNVQNLSVMRQVGNVSVDINNNNERTKSISYQIDVKSSSPLAIDEYLIESGTTVTWAGESYLIESSSYQAQSKTRYVLTFTAKDMAKMMIGNPSESTDAFGQKTRSATWRYSASVYDAWVQPEIGDDASEYVGLPAGSGYLINNISSTPDGVLGYTVTFEARHVSLRHLRKDERLYKNGEDIGYEVTNVYQSDENNRYSLSNQVGLESVENPGTVVNEVSVNQVAKGEYEITVVAGTDDSESSYESLSDDVNLSMSSSELVIDPYWCGWALSVSGLEYYPINFPPTTMFSYQMSLSTLTNMESSTSGMVRGWTEEDVINAIKSGSPIGYDWILYPIGTYRTTGSTTAYGKIPKSKYQDIRVGDISELMMSGYVYAQPSWASTETEVAGSSVRNIYFRAWNCLESSPIVLQRSHISNYPKLWGRDLYWQYRYINYKLPMMECSVTKNYRGNSRTVVKRGSSSFFADAVRYIKSSAFTSYKGINISYNEITDQYRNTWTSVTCTIQALSEMYWNPHYDTHYVEN